MQAARECGWSASTTAAWIALGATQGQGETSLKYSVHPNAAGLPRNGSVNVSGRVVDVVQEAAPCRFSLDQTGVDAPGAESTSELGLDAPAGCAWAASSQTDWLTLLETQGSGPGRVRVRIAANTGGARTGIVTVAGIRVEVRQAGANAPAPAPGTPAPQPPEPPPPPAPGECHFSFSPAAGNIGASGGDGEVRLVTGADCDWTIASDAPWLSLRSAAQGRGEAQVVYRAAANASTEARTGRLTAGGAAFVLDQAGRSESPLPPPTCAFDVSPLQQAFEAPGGTGTIGVKAGKDCAWTAEAQDSWITVTDGSSGSGDGDVRFRVPANTGAERTGKLLVAGQTVTITQAAGLSEVEVTVEGDIKALQGECPSVTFGLADDTVQTTAATLYKQGGCGKLKDGISVRVRGLRIPGGSRVTALDVEFTKLEQIAQ